MNSHFLLIVSGLVFNGIAGSFFFLAWILMNRILQERMYLEASYKILQAVILFFCIPIFGILEAREAAVYVYSDILTNPMPSRFHVLWTLLLVTWFSGMAILFLAFLHSRARVHRIAQMGSMPASLAWQAVAEEAKKAVGVRSQVVCRERYGETSAFIVGILHPTIYFPVGQFSYEQMYVMAVHEMNHLRSCDLLWKLLSGLIRIVYWPLALVWMLNRETDAWSEYFCDFQSCHVLNEDYAGYVDVLIELICKRVKWFSPAWVSCFYKSPDDLHARVRSLAKRKKMGRLTLRLTMVLSLLFFGIGCSTAYAATRYAMVQCRDAYWETLDKDVISIEEVPPLEVADDLQMADPALLGLDEISSEDWFDGSLNGIRVTPDQGTLFFDQLLIPGETAVSVLFDNMGSRQFFLSCSVEEVSAGICLGIIDPEGRCFFRMMGEVPDEGMIFPCRIDGEYQFFIRNCDSKEISVFGMGSLVDQEVE